MTSSQSVRRLLIVLCMSVMAGVVSAQVAQEKFKPEVGQDGKDVVWVPTPQSLVDEMLDLANLTPKDFVIDLGSGDGRTVITAAKRGAKAHGIEYNPDMVALAKRLAAEAGVADRATFEKADLFESDFSRATVITMFLLTDINIRLRPQLLELKPGTRIVSNTFRMGEWTPDEEVTADENVCEDYCTAYLWIVPAKASGVWQFAGGELRLEQEFQMLSGNLVSGGRTTPITDGWVRAEQVSISVGDAEYQGRLNGNVIEGTVKTKGNSRPWKATRAAK
jgi:SAM-dependent methyltransferase